MISNKRYIIVLVLSFYIFFARNAYAYLDPGTGIYFFQIVLATILGALMTAKLSWKKLKSLINRFFKRKSKSPDND
jgi:hypothetical protein